MRCTQHPVHSCFLPWFHLPSLGALPAANIFPLAHYANNYQLDGPVMRKPAATSCSVYEVFGLEEGPVAGDTRLVETDCPIDDIWHLYPFSLLCMRPDIVMLGHTVAASVTWTVKLDCHCGTELLMFTTTEHPRFLALDRLFHVCSAHDTA